ncbi:MAG: glutamate--tRNA ligase, partial [Firmicutes bacterium]|nr:glutamate--tRNA ligase [Bacillota bacterium]
KSAQEIYDFELAWANEFAPEKAALLSADPERTKKIFDIDRGGEKPRKDLIFAQQIFQFISYFFDETFETEAQMPAECSADDIREIFRRYKEGYSETDDNAAWFEKIRSITADMGYAVKPKDYKKNPDQYKGHVGHVSNCIRIALTGRSNSPDLWTIQQIMGREQVFARLDRAEAALKAE